MRICGTYDTAVGVVLGGLRLADEPMLRTVERELLEEMAAVFCIFILVRVGVRVRILSRLDFLALHLPVFVFFGVLARKAVFVAHLSFFSHLSSGHVGSDELVQQTHFLQPLLQPLATCFAFWGLAKLLSSCVSNRKHWPSKKYR